MTQTKRKNKHYEAKILFHNICFRTKYWAKSEREARKALTNIKGSKIVAIWQTS